MSVVVPDLVYGGGGGGGGLSLPEDIFFSNCFFEFIFLD